MDGSLMIINEFLHVDDVLNHLNALGRFQKLLLTAFCIMMLPVAFPTLIMYFAAIEPTWSCAKNSSICTVNGTLSIENKLRCEIPRSEWEFVESPTRSIVIQFDLSCEREWLIHLTKSVLFIGWGVGAIIFGWVADNFGRKITFFPSLFLVMAIGLISIFSQSIIVLIMAQFFIGFFISGSLFQMQIWMSEFTVSEYRPIAVNIIRCMYPLACALLGLQAYYIREWKTLVLACTAPYLFTFVFVFFMPESIHWLHDNNGSNKLRKVLQRMASINKKHLAQDFSLPPKTTGPVKSRSNPIDLFRPASVAIKTCILGYAWLIGGMTIFGLTFAAGDLGGSIYLNFILISLSEIPGIIAQTYFCGVLGHKKTACISTLVTGIFCFVIAVIISYGNITIALRIFGVFGKMLSSVALSSLIIWSFELFPTKTRAQAIGFLQVTSRLGASMAPWISNALRHVYVAAPFLVMGVTAFISACLLMTIRERDEDFDQQNKISYEEDENVSLAQT